MRAIQGQSIALPIIYMKKNLFLLAALSICVVVSAQHVKTAERGMFSVYAVGFYNQENLFDTCHDAGKRDQDFLPAGQYRWDGLKYSHKLHNMARALADMGTDILPHTGCAVIGLSEVEGFDGPTRAESPQLSVLSHRRTRQTRHRLRLALQPKAV